MNESLVVHEDVSHFEVPNLLLLDVFLSFTNSQWIDKLIELEEMPGGMPIFIGGISLGGLLAASSLKILKHRQRITALSE